jgi:hypothetical protein
VSYGLRAMSARLLATLLGACALAAAGPGAAGAQAAASGAPRVDDQETGNPIDDQGSSYDYRSIITRVTPSVPGLSVEVLQFADRLLLRNHTGETVTIYGYEGEPYARVLANGTAEQNVRAPATYLNTNFYANVTVPSSASPSAAPRWEVIDRTGEFEWHDHRIHWMSPVAPAKVKDKSRRTWIFDWNVPITVGATKATIDGELFWTPENSNAPVAAIVLGVAIALGGLAFVVFVRRRRARASSGADRLGVSPSGDDASPSREAW